jgi:hypothetical protein
VPKTRNQFIGKAHRQEAQGDHQEQHVFETVLLQKSKSAMFDGCNHFKYLDMIFDKSVKNWFLQQNPHDSLTENLRHNHSMTCVARL